MHTAFISSNSSFGGTLVNPVTPASICFPGTDFGWGRPKKVELVSIDKTDAVSLMDSKNGGGAVEIGLALKKSQMEVFARLHRPSEVVVYGVIILVTVDTSVL